MARYYAIREAVNTLGVRLCPHLLANDKIILNSFHSDCTKVTNCRSPFPRCAHNAGNPPRCTSRRTSVYFQVSESKKDGSSSVTLVVYRHLGKRGGGITDPDWIAQPAMPEEIIEMQKEWETSVMSRCQALVEKASSSLVFGHGDWGWDSFCDSE